MNLVWGTRKGGDNNHFNSETLAKSKYFYFWLMIFKGACGNCVRSLVGGTHLLWTAFECSSPLGQRLESFSFYNIPVTCITLMSSLQTIFALCKVESKEQYCFPKTNDTAKFCSSCRQYFSVWPIKCAVKPSKGFVYNFWYASIGLKCITELPLSGFGF